MTVMPPSSERRAAIAAVARYEPVAIRTSEEIEHMVRTASGRFPAPRGTVRSVTGIDRRHVLADDEQASTLAASAGQLALQSAGLQPPDLDLLIFGAASADMVEPATAHMVADAMGASCPVFDVKNACNSFLNAVQVADALIRTHQADRILVVSGETPTRAVRYAVTGRRDLREAFAGFTFGDLGTAVVLEAATDGRGILHSEFIAVSRHWAIGGLPGGGSRHPRGDQWTYFAGDGAKIKAAFDDISPAIVQRALAATGTCFDDYAVILAHQVTMPFITEFVRRVGIPPDKCVITLPRYGNVASGTLPLGLSIAIDEKRAGPGDLVLLIGLAGGISAGTMVVRL